MHQCRNKKTNSIEHTKYQKRSRKEIGECLREMDYEWDIERALELNFATFVAGTTLNQTNA